MPAQSNGLPLIDYSAPLAVNNLHYDPSSGVRYRGQTERSAPYHCVALYLLRSSIVPHWESGWTEMWLDEYGRYVNKTFPEMDRSILTPLIRNA